MSGIKILNKTDIKKFESPPEFYSDNRKVYLNLTPWVKYAMKERSRNSGRL